MKYTLELTANVLWMFNNKYNDLDKMFIDTFKKRDMKHLLIDENKDYDTELGKHNDMLMTEFFSYVCNMKDALSQYITIYTDDVRCDNDLIQIGNDFYLKYYIDFELNLKEIWDKFSDEGFTNETHP